MAIKAVAFLGSFSAFGDGTYSIAMDFQTTDSGYTGDRRATATDLTITLTNVQLVAALKQSVSDNLVANGGSFTPLVDTIAILQSTVLA